MLSVAAASEILLRPKIMVASMSWVRKLNREEGAWLAFESAIQFESDALEAPEGLFVRGLWRPPEGVKPSNFGFGFFFGNDRIYAVDVKPVGKHKNTAGNGRTLHGKTISGIHEHTWSSDGYGYAEPVDMMRIDEAWKLFESKTGISGASFTHPDNGQPGLDL